MTRKTIRDELRWSGVGVHSGRPSVAILRPGTDGLTWSRRTITPALAQETIRCTGLVYEDQRLMTVEHLLSALNGLGVTDADIDADGEEMPILDGSALPFAEAIWATGLELLDGESARPQSRIEQQINQSSVSLAPGAGLVEVFIDFSHPSVGNQHIEVPLTPETYLREIAPARTFGFLNEAEQLKLAGLAQGASLENTVVFSAEGPMTPLRFTDEPVRHKALDLIGDLALSGISIYNLNVRAERPGHAINCTAASRLFEGG